MIENYPGVIHQMIDEPASEYHRQARNNLSSHQLGTFRRCPAEFRMKCIGDIAEKDSAAYAVGRALHTLCLEGADALAANYLVGGPVNPKTGKTYGRDTQKFSAWVDEQGGGEYVSPEELETIEAMTAAVRGHDFASKLLEHGRAEGVLRANMCGFACQVRCDWFSPEWGLIDLKTCKNLDWFENDFRIFGYGHQLAFYRQVIREACGTTPEAYVIAVEKSGPPYRVGVWKVSERTLKIHAQENAKAIRELGQCLNSNTWPTRYEGLKTIDLVA